MLRRAAVTLVLLGGGLPWLVAASPTQAGPIVPPPGQVPEVGVTPPVTRFGATVRANLNGWRSPLVVASICGDEARRGSEDCDQPGSVGVLISKFGEGSALLTARPPVDCPCVIRASTPDNSIVRTAPIEIKGVPVLRPDQLFPLAGESAPATQLRLDVRLDDQSSVLSWFGLSATRRLRVTLHNLGSTALGGLSLSATVGHTAPGSHAVAMPDVPLIPAYGSATMWATVDLDTPSYGSYVVTGRVDGLSRPVRFAVATDSTPWGLVLAGVLGGVLLALLALRHRQRPLRGVTESGDTPAPRDGDHESVSTSRTTDDAEANNSLTGSTPPEPDTTLTGSELQEQMR
jgi:hypothetical protein